MSAPAAIRDYSDLIEVLRARAVGLKTTRLQIDDCAGLPSGYTAKLLSRKKLRCLGHASLGPILQALGLMLVPVEDPAAIERIHGRYVRVHATRPAEAEAYGDGLEEAPASNVARFQAAVRDLTRELLGPPERAGSSGETD